MARTDDRARTTSVPTLRLVLSTVPPRRAGPIAKALVVAGVAACVNVVRGVRSVYRWRGRVHDEAEALLIVKTPRKRLAACVRALVAAHPYAVPEVVVVAPGRAGAAYDAWARVAAR